MVVKLNSKILMHMPSWFEWDLISYIYIVAYVECGFEPEAWWGGIL